MHWVGSKPLFFLRGHPVSHTLPLRTWLLRIKARRESCGTRIDGAKKVSVMHGSLIEVRSREIGEPQVGASKISESELCSPDVGSIQDCQSQLRTLEIGSAKISVAKIGTL